MKTLVVYYSYSGRSRAVAEKLAKAESLDIAEIKDVRHVSKLKAYTAGIVASIKGKPWPIQPLVVEWLDYTRLILFAPIWAGNPPPAFNAFMEQLPAGKVITLKMVSASGTSDCKERMEKAIIEKGCTLETFEDIKIPRKAH